MHDFDVRADFVQPRTVPTTRTSRLRLSLSNEPFRSLHGSLKNIASTSGISMAHRKTKTLKASLKQRTTKADKGPEAPPWTTRDIQWETAHLRPGTTTVSQAPLLPSHAISKVFFRKPRRKKPRRKNGEREQPESSPAWHRPHFLMSGMA